MAEKVNQGQADKAAAEQRTAQVAAEAQKDADTAAQRLTDATPAEAPAVAVDPYPPYGDKSADELKSLAEGRGVQINRDVEKAELVKQLRKKDPANAALDFMPLEDLRALAADKDVELPEEFVTAHLITELRAADTGVRNSGDHVL
jgi:hypothetical protein